MQKRILSLLLMLVLLLSMPLAASAHEVPDFDRPGSISITMAYKGEPVSGGTLTIYRVADVVSEDGDYLFSYTDDYAGCSIPVTELDSSGLPAELAKIAQEKELMGTSKVVDKNGEVTFSDLKLGLYLVVQKYAASGYKKVNPFLVSVPYNDDGHYVYDVDTAPKNLPGPEAEPTTAPTNPPVTDPKLPQTGQTNWPVPVMAVVGLLLITAGICFCSGGKRKRDEA